MNNVDTLSLMFNYKNHCIDVGLDLYEVNNRIVKRLYPATDDTNTVDNKETGYRGGFNGYGFYYNSSWFVLTVIVPHNKVEEYTAEEIESDVIDSVKTYFQLSEEEIPRIELSRIDIKNDFLCQTADSLNIIKNILSKSKESIYTYKKITKIGKDGRYITVYTSRNKNGKRKRQIFEHIQIEDIDEDDVTDEITDNHKKSSNYIEFVFYDKDKETQHRAKTLEADEDEIKKYKDIFRCEIRIKNRRLNYNKYEYGIDKILDNYYDSDTTSEIYHKCIKEVLGTQDFHRIDVALDIIDTSLPAATPRQQLKKDKIMELVELVNKVGVSKAMGIWSEKCSKPTFYNHKKVIESLGINLITFDKCIDGKNVELKKLANFGQMKNGVRE